MTKRSTHTPSQRTKTTDPARYLAYDILREVDTSDAYANLLLPPRLHRQSITGRDAAFTTELTYGTLRMRGRYDAILHHCTTRPVRDIDPPVLDILRLGCHQILGMRVATHAAVSETVALARTRTGAGSAQFVNAVLRQVAATPLDQWLHTLTTEAPDELTALAHTTSHPLWIVRAMREALLAAGRNPTELEALLAANNTPPTVTLVARPGLATPADLPGTTPATYAPTAHHLNHGNPSRIPAITHATAGVQDEGSQLVTLALTETPIEGPDQRWLDMCAGPGGKAALLGAIAAQRGARLVANEITPHRAQLVRTALSAIPPAAIEAIHTADGRDIGTNEPGSYDRILLDAPCTGLGALRRRPEARWRRTPTDLMALTALQRELLTSALTAIRPGGVVAYITCSPHHAETQLVITDITRKRRDIEILDAPTAIQSITHPNVTLDHPDRPHAQLWPHIHGTDAMHLTLLKRHHPVG